MPQMTAPSPSLVAGDLDVETGLGADRGLDVAHGPDLGRRLDLDSRLGGDAGAADLASLIGIPHEPGFLEDICALVGAYTGFGATSPLVADIIGDAVAAAMAAAILIERSPIGGDVAPRLPGRPAMPAGPEWRDHSGEGLARGALRNSLYDLARISLARSPAPPTDGQICALFAADIVGFTRPDRDDDIRMYLHEELYRILRKSFDDSGIPWASCLHEDRGDGALVVVPPGIVGKGILHPLPERLRGLIRRHNHVSCDAARIQLRVAAHIGPVDHDGEGFIGSDINFMFRMLEARSFKRALVTSAAELALIVSDYVYRDLVCRYPSLLSPDAFRPIRFQVKHTRARAWTYLPGVPS